MEIGNVELMCIIVGSVGTLFTGLYNILKYKQKIIDQKNDYENKMKNAISHCNGFIQLSHRAENTKQAKLIANGSMGGGFNRWKSNKEKDIERIKKINIELDRLIISKYYYNKNKHTINTLNNLCEEIKTIKLPYENIIK